MSDIEADVDPALDEALSESEIVHWSPKRGPLIGSGHPTGLEPPQGQATPVLAVGALAAGAWAMGAMAIGALAIGRLVVARARFKELKIDRLVIDELVVRRRRG